MIPLQYRSTTYPHALDRRWTPCKWGWGSRETRRPSVSIHPSAAILFSVHVHTHKPAARKELPLLCCKLTDEARHIFWPCNSASGDGRCEGLRQGGRYAVTRLTFSTRIRRYIHVCIREWDRASFEFPLDEIDDCFDLVHISYRARCKKRASRVGN